MREECKECRFMDYCGEKLTCSTISQIANQTLENFARWLHKNYIVNDNHHEEVSIEDLLWEYRNK